MTQTDAEVVSPPESNSGTGVVRRCLFVVFHEIAPTIFESQIAVHVNDMRAIGIEMEVWVFPRDLKRLELSRTRAPALAAQHGVNIRVFRGFHFGLMLADLLNVFSLWLALRNGSFTPYAVHARTDYSAFICGLLRPFFGYDLIWDCRGDVIAEQRMAHANPGLLKRIRLSLRIAMLRIQRTAARHLCTRAVFVSQALRSVCVGNDFSIPSEIIPCVASPQLFYFSPELRNSVRQTLEIASECRTFIYSGSISFFQCFDESVALFRRVLENDPHAIYIVATPNCEAASRALNGLPKQNLRLLSTTITNVNGLLNAADFGVLLRQNNPVNQVASPVKFAEYCLAGLPIIMTDAVEQSVQIGRELGNALVTDLDNNPEPMSRWTDADRQSLSRNAAKRLGRDAVKEAYRRTYAASARKES